MKEMKDLNKQKEIHIHALKNSMHAIGIGKKNIAIDIWEIDHISIIIL